MNNGLKLGLLSVAAGLAMHAGNANAELALHTISGNAVNYCQAFTPGPANTIRNRVVGSENVGPNAMNVACNFHSVSDGDVQQRQQSGRPVGVLLQQEDRRVDRLLHVADQLPGLAETRIW